MPLCIFHIKYKIVVIGREQLHVAQLSHTCATNGKEDHDGHSNDKGRGHKKRDNSLVL